MFHVINATLSLGMGLAGGQKSIGGSWFLRVFESSLGWEFELGFFGLQIGCWVVRKKCI